MMKKLLLSFFTDTAHLVYHAHEDTLTAYAGIRKAMAGAIAFVFVPDGGPAVMTMMFASLQSS